MSCGLGEWAIILVIVLLVVGVPRLPKIGASIGGAVRSFRRAYRSNDEIRVRRREPDEPPKEG